MIRKTSLTVLVVLIATFAFAATPTITYSTFLGGTGSDQVVKIAVDINGNTYALLTGDSTDVPTTSNAYSKAGNIVVAKFGPSGTLIYSTYLGFNGIATGIAADASGHAFVTGTTAGTFPATSGAYQTVRKGSSDIFVVKLNATGSGYVYATLLGGSGDSSNGDDADEARAITTDGNGNAYVTGSTNSANFPITSGAWKKIFLGTAVCGDRSPLLCSVGFLTKLNASGTGLVFSTYLGANNTSGQAVTVDRDANVYVTGFAGSGMPATTGTVQVGNKLFFVTKLNASGGSQQWTARIGGDDAGDRVGAIGIDTTHNVYIAGETQSHHFPTTSGAFQHRDYDAYTTNFWDMFVSSLSPGGRVLRYSTVVGGTATERFGDMRVDASGHAYLAGSTVSTDYPTKNALKTKLTNTGQTCGIEVVCSDAVITKLNASGSGLDFSTYRGGGMNDSALAIGIDANLNIISGGFTDSSDFPTTSNGADRTFAGQSEGWLTKLNMSGTSSSGCAVPTTVGVVVCSPANNSTVSSPVTVSAAAKGNATITTMKIYRDNTAVFSITGNSFSTSISVSSGAHRLTIKAWDKNGTSYSKAVSITVK